MSESVSFKLNGKDVTVPKGWTVMQAAKQEDVAIPHFCWHEGLSIAGVCRFCMVKVEGRPKLEISCNLPVADGMVVSTVDEEVKEAHKWALEFHLINHPLDCPICDQAGECGLQNYYMDVGKYDSQMTRPKVLKPKALDVGGDLVLDTERCILCSRCVRFEEEITKSNALGIFDRGDRAIIGTYPGKKITHNYTTNLVDICPVGAFTSKDFRFKQRVWFLEDKPSVCPGCSAGCNVDVYSKVQTRKFFRLKPRASDVNGHWMCDDGRHYYEHLNKENRLLFAYSSMGDAGSRSKIGTEEALGDLAVKLKESQDLALLVAPQYTNEELRSVLEHFKSQYNLSTVYAWRDTDEKPDEFDGILRRGDRNSNTKGFEQITKDLGFNVKSFTDLGSSGSNTIVALAPEIFALNSSIDDQLRSLSELGFVSLWTLDNKAMGFNFNQVIPMKGFAEKSGTFTNHAGKQGELNAFPAAVKAAVSVTEAVAAMSGSH